jgi:hypothetical protein
VRAGVVASPLEKGLEINRVDLPPGPLGAACQIRGSEFSGSNQTENLVAAAAKEPANRRRSEKLVVRKIARHKKTSVESELDGGIVSLSLSLLMLKRRIGKTFPIVSDSFPISSLSC